MTQRLRYRLLSLISVLLLVIVAAALIKGEGPMAKKVYVVDIKTSRTPVFPDQCAVCMQPQQETVTFLALTATHGRMEYYFYGFTKPYPNEHTLQVPVHTSCVKKIRNDFSKRIIMIIVAVALIGATFYAGRWGGFWSAMVGLLALGVLLSFTLNAPMPVEYSFQRPGEMRFFFKDKVYAEDFARRNSGTVREGAYLSEYLPG